ncbi:hypothetical protein DFH06DRAFT_1420728 [Mycena polygramma]|nr:hypothetical protein DFH06DRAFT_1420728 [Mycena polygramma]
MFLSKLKYTVQQQVEADVLVSSVRSDIPDHPSHKFQITQIRVQVLVTPTLGFEPKHALCRSIGSNMRKLSLRNDSDGDAEISSEHCSTSTVFSGAVMVSTGVISGARRTALATRKIVTVLETTGSPLGSPRVSADCSRVLARTPTLKGHVYSRNRRYSLSFWSRAILGLKTFFQEGRRVAFPDFYGSGCGDTSANSKICQRAQTLEGTNIFYAIVCLDSNRQA